MSIDDTSRQEANTGVIRRLWTLFSDQKWDESKELFHKDFIAEWPQSRERFSGAENFVEMNRAYPGNHRIEVRELCTAGDQVVSAVYIQADTGQKAFATSFFTLRDGKIAKVTEYWAEPYDAPAWRAKWVQNY